MPDRPARNDHLPLLIADDSALARYLADYQQGRLCTGIGRLRDRPRRLDGQR
jgi:hypothetical protein